MDPERQPLLRPIHSDVRNRGFRTLTYEEVQIACKQTVWRRTRFAMFLMFWGIMAMFLSITVCILIQTPKCGSKAMAPTPSVPPVHLSLSPLFFQHVKTMDDDQIYSI